MENIDLQIHGMDNFKAIIAFFFVEYLSEDDQKMPKCETFTTYLHIVVSNYSVVVGIPTVPCFTAANTNTFKIPSYL
jgi:hypothetical protein